MNHLKEVRQSLDISLSPIQDALNELELIEEKGEINAEIIEAVSNRIFNVVDELNECDVFIQKLSECKTVVEMEALVNAG